MPPTDVVTLTFSNSNAWKIQISHAAISVFAASHFVPTSNSVNETSRNTRQGTIRIADTRTVTECCV